MAGDDLRAFMQEILLRKERVMGAMGERLRENAQGLRNMQAETRELVEQMRAQRGEFVDECRAQRAALFRMLDRLDGGGAGPAGS